MDRKPLHGLKHIKTILNDMIIKIAENPDFKGKY
jgi:hypothetical protein